MHETADILDKRQEIAEKNIVILTLSAELDHHNILELRQLLESETQAGNLRLIINLAQVQFIYSAHIAVFWTCWKNCTSQNGQLVFSSASATVNKLIGSLNIGKVIKSYPSDAAALEAIE